MKRYYINILSLIRTSLGLTATAMLLMVAFEAEAGNWIPLAKDGLHDPKSPSFNLLQEPSEGMRGLPPDKDGNMVDWAKAVASGVISPRRGDKQIGTTPPMHEEEFILNSTGSMAKVLFSHKAHELWLECSNCHPAVFEPKKGANLFKMEKILNGEQCGLCHGAVAFPPTECNRCHNVQHKNGAAPAAAQPARR